MAGFPREPPSGDARSEDSRERVREATSLFLKNLASSVEERAAASNLSQLITSTPGFVLKKDRTWVQGLGQDVLVTGNTRISSIRAHITGVTFTAPVTLDNATATILFTNCIFRTNNAPLVTIATGALVVFSGCLFDGAPTLLINHGGLAANVVVTGCMDWTGVGYPASVTPVGSL